MNVSAFPLCRHHLRVALMAAAATILFVSAAESQITRIVIDKARSESPTFEGRAFGPNGSVGRYEKLRARAYGELDPADPRNAIITDLKLAPRNARGKVEYSMDVFILKPMDLTKGNHKLILDFNNRGEMRIAALNDAPLRNNPTTAADAGTGFVMNLGYSVVGNGWDFGASSDDDGMTISVPVARNPDGSSITGPSYRVHHLRRCKGRSVPADLSDRDIGQSRRQSSRYARASTIHRRPCPRAGGSSPTRRRFASCRPEPPSNRATSTNSATRPGIRWSRRWDSRRRAISSRSCATHRETNQALPIRSQATCVMSSHSPYRNRRAR